MSKTTRVAIGIFAAFLVIVSAVYLIFLRPGGNGPEPIASTSLPTPEATPMPTPSLAERLSARLAGVTLKTSDVAVRELVGQLSSHPKVAAWLANDDLVRRFVAAVDNIADGRSPRQHLDFLRPATPFRVLEKDGSIVADPASFARYRAVVDVVSAVDATDAVTLYRELEPLFDDAYREISPPGWVFRDRLTTAIDQLVSVPVPTGEPELEVRTVATYEYVDQPLATLSDAQRQLLRLGPDNMRAVQAKLREIRDLLEARE